MHVLESRSKERDRHVLPVEPSMTLSERQCSHITSGGSWHVILVPAAEEVLAFPYWLERSELTRTWG